MLFNSLVFLYGFLPVTWLVFWRLRTRRQRYVWLTFTGYVFYAGWDWRFCGLMLFSTLVSYTAGVGLLDCDDEARRRRLLVLPVATDLCLLGFFKYADFGLASAQAVTHALGLPVAFRPLHIVLPIGISFYTFHTITYIVDSYRRTIRPTRDFFEFACYVSLFSQLVAGPIVRFREIEADLDRIDQLDRSATIARGWSFFVLGLAQKVLLADTLAAVIDPALKHWESLSTGGAWVVMLGYSYQLLFDFAGYSDMAVGLGLMFGLHIPQNFNSPYQALDVGDFWRRWHISLSRCLRDYLYIPLGGNRGGAAFVARNLMLTMLLGGLWHGASWTFVGWGGYHGVLLVLQRQWGHRWARLPAAVRQAGTFGLVVGGWVLFRATSFGMAGGLLLKMLRPCGGDWPVALPGLVGGLLVAGWLAHRGRNSWQMDHAWRPAQVVLLVVLFALCLLRIAGGQPSPFLYFQF